MPLAPHGLHASQACLPEHKVKVRLQPLLQVQRLGPWTHSPAARRSTAASCGCLGTGLQQGVEEVEEGEEGPSLLTSCPGVFHSEWLQPEPID